jgi:hypothetical protein
MCDELNEKIFLCKNELNNVRTTLPLECSRNHCFRGNAIIRSFFIVVGIDLTVNNINMLSVAMEMQQ